MVRAFALRARRSEVGRCRELVALAEGTGESVLADLEAQYGCPTLRRRSRRLRRWVRDNPILVERVVGDLLVAGEWTLLESPE